MKSWRTIGVWIAVGILLAIAWGGLRAGGVFGPHQGHRLDPLPQDAVVQVYFNLNTDQGADFKERERGIKRPGDDFEQIILDQLNQATRHIDIAVQELRLPRIAQLLVAKHQAGVQVRVILENSYNQPISEAIAAPEDQDRYQSTVAYLDQNGDGRISSAEETQRDAIVILRQGQVPLIDDTADGTKGTGLMHHKFAVIDQQTVIVTSANFTASDFFGDYTAPQTRGNANNLLVIPSPALAQIFTQEFELMWGDGPDGQPDSRFGIQKPPRPPQVLTLGNTQVTVKFSPDRPATPFAQTSNGLIAQYLHQARERIALALFVFSDQTLADRMNDRFQAGVQVKALIDPGFAFRSYSEGLDLLGVTLLENCKAESQNRPWAKPATEVGAPALPEGDKLHHKLGVIDGQTVITGSHNWSAAANHTNDETLLILTNPAIAAHYERELDRLAAITDFGLPPTVKRRIEEQGKTCAMASPTPSPLATATPQGLVNLNQASAEELATLPGIGPSLAQRIITARQQRPFSSLEDLDRVKGIGPAKLQDLRGRVRW